MLLLRLSHCFQLVTKLDTLLAGVPTQLQLIQNALLLLRFNLTDQSKTDNNTSSGLLRQEGDFRSGRRSTNSCLHAIMKNLYRL
jgi:hypothetical protein